MKSWGDVYNKYLGKGHDHGSAAFEADQWQKRNDAQSARLCTTDNEIADAITTARAEGRKQGLDEAAALVANSPTPNDLLRWTILALKDKEAKP